MIDTESKLVELLPLIREAPWVAVDTEADSLHAYPEKLCLLQISVPGQDVLVDPLVGLNLAPLLDLLGGRELIIHGADYDLRMLQADLGFVPARVFDTMLAARLVGLREFGLNHLVSHFLGVVLEKGPQKANWAQRPLSARLIAYAQNDTRYLEPVAARLSALLAERGRLAWHQQTCARLIEDCTRRAPIDPDTVWRVKGCDRLDRRPLGVVRELWHWREREAVGANKPPFFVLSHETLVALALAASQGESLEPWIPARYSPRRRGGVAEAVQRAMALPEEQLPHRPQHRGRRLTLAEKRRLEELRQRRDAASARLELDPALIASRATLLALAHDWQTNGAALLPWQRELLGGGLDGAPPGPALRLPLTEPRAGAPRSNDGDSRAPATSRR